MEVMQDKVARLTKNEEEVSAMLNTLKPNGTSYIGGSVFRTFTAIEAKICNFPKPYGLPLPPLEDGEVKHSDGVDFGDEWFASYF